MSLSSLRRLRAPVAALAALLAVSVAEARNCPQVGGQAVVVPHATATPIRLNIRDVGNATVSVIGYPQGGQLVPIGNSPVDWLFVPDGDFAGQTTLTYRVTPPTGCTGTDLIGSVQIAIEGAPQVDVDVDGSVGVRPVVCGVDLLPVVLPPFLACIGLSRVRRRAINSGR